MCYLFFFFFTQMPVLFGQGVRLCAFTCKQNWTSNDGVNVPVVAMSPAPAPTPVREAIVLYPLYTFIAVYAPVYTRYTCTYTIRTPNHTSKHPTYTPHNTPYTPYIHHYT